MLLLTNIFFMIRGSLINKTNFIFSISGETANKVIAERR